ncbi:hypothetical protein GOV10_01505 [Candidatus Woesearchaeota archaeon]|nr:hypothetical protein [Candidatus Woesearchaeota archaeon]
MVKQLLIKGNSKMGPHVFLYNLPAKETCTPTAWCLEGRDGKPRCYGLRNNFLLPSVVKAAHERLEHSKEDDFVERMVAEIQKKNVEYFRWHSSGDFHSEEYVRKVMDIAEACPDVKFRTTTRRRDLTDVIQELNALPNFIVRESLDGGRDTPIMGLPFAAAGKLPVVGEETYLCPDDCPECDYECWKGPINMYFEEF